MSDDHFSIGVKNGGSVVEFASICLDKRASDQVDFVRLCCFGQRISGGIWNLLRVRSEVLVTVWSVEGFLKTVKSGIHVGMKTKTKTEG